MADKKAIAPKKEAEQAATAGCGAGSHRQCFPSRAGGGAGPTWQAEAYPTLSYDVRERVRE
jgi:hypothetical protein